MKGQRRLFAIAAVSAAMLVAGCSSGASTASSSVTSKRSGRAPASQRRTARPVGAQPRLPATSSRSGSSPSSRSTSTTRWSTRPRPGTSRNPTPRSIFAQGKSGTDDEGEIAAIQSMVTQGVQGHRDHAHQPQRPGCAAEGGRRGNQGRPDRQRHPGLARARLPWSPPTTSHGGKLAGEWLAANLPAGATIGVLQGVLGNPSLDDRVTGMTRDPRMTRRPSSPRHQPTATRPRD